VLEASGDVNLAREPAVRAFGQDLLEGDRATELGVERFDDATHATTTELVADPVAIERHRRPYRNFVFFFSGWNGVVDFFPPLRVTARFAATT
jgi:hypothetical protein